VPAAGITEDHARIVLWNFLNELKDVEQILLTKESRMYSASLLFVYEGHPEAFKSALDAIENAPDPKPDVGEEAEEEDDDREDEERSKVHALKLIDFAHAKFQNGLGPDQNMLAGVKSTIRVLELLLKEISA
jgi:1D-myo-inositol-tetrakisphosphate 5-kinase/inositol-polyphosphate multikinase